MAEEPVRIFWTGGWDSTYRVLELVLVGEKRVAPVYVVDPGRRTAPLEIETMDRLRHAIAERWPRAAALIAPTRAVDVDHIPECPQISRSFRSLRKRLHVGAQYEWLARLAAAEDLSGIEMAIHREEHAAPLTELLIENIESRDGTASIAASAPADLRDVFGSFSFPVIALTKPDMAERARAAGFVGVMDRTWFCLNPDQRGRPCGWCIPCQIAAREGMGHRIPLPGRLRRRLWRASAPLRLARHLARRAVATRSRR